MFFKADVVIFQRKSNVYMNVNESALDIDGEMVSVIALNPVDRALEPWSGQTKYY